MKTGLKIKISENILFHSSSKNHFKRDLSEDQLELALIEYPYRKNNAVKKKEGEAGDGSIGQNGENNENGKGGESLKTLKT